MFQLLQPAGLRQAARQILNPKSQFRNAKSMTLLQTADPALWDAIRHEMTRQHDGLELIASENYTSAAVLEAAGTVLTNKYAEGYPGRRYYGGCAYVDILESLAAEP